MDVREICHTARLTEWQERILTSTGTTEYTLHGKNIVHMTRGNHTLHFHYDGQVQKSSTFFHGIRSCYRADEIIFR